MLRPEHKASVQRLFNRLATPYARFVFSRLRQETRQDVTWMKPQAHERALDLACGPGTLALELARHGCRVYAFDLAEQMLARARQAARTGGAQELHFAVGDVEHLPLPTGGFDLVTCSFSLANFPAPHDAVAEICRVTRPGGRVAVLEVVAPEDPAERAEFNRLEQLRSGGAPTRLLSLRDLLALYRQANLDLLDACVSVRQRRLDDWLTLGHLGRTPQARRRLREQVLQTAKENTAGLHLERHRRGWVFHVRVARLLWRK